MKIALIGEDTESKAKIREYFAQNNDYEFVFDEADGYKALQYFDENDVDVVITPIMLPELNAFDLMEHFRNKKSMKFLILSELKSEAFMMRCLTSGAAGYLLKPVNCAVLAEKLQNLQSAKTTFTTTGKPSNLGKTLDEKISNIFITVGIPAHIKGYQYLRDGIKLVVENSHQARNRGRLEQRQNRKHQQFVRHQNLYRQRKTDQRRVHCADSGQNAAGRNLIRIQFPEKTGCLPVFFVI